MRHFTEIFTFHTKEGAAFAAELLLERKFPYSVCYREPRDAIDRRMYVEYDIPRTERATLAHSAHVRGAIKDAGPTVTWGVRWVDDGVPMSDIATATDTA